MKYFYGLLLAGFIVSCGNKETEDPISNEAQIDTLNNGIIEYELNEERLSAVDYNNKISLIQQNVYDQINTLFLSDPNTVAQNHDNTLFELTLKSSDLESTIAPEGGEDLKVALNNLLSFYETELKGDFLPILKLIEIDEEERSREQEYKIIDYDEQFAIKEASYFEAIAVEQDKFASANNFKISDL